MAIPINVEGIKAFGSKAGTIIAASLAGIIIVGIIGYLIWWFMVKKQYNIKVRILSERYGKTGKYFEDVGAYIQQKDGIKIFRLRKNKIELPQPNFQDALIPTKEGNILFLRQTAQGEYYPIDPAAIFGHAKYKVIDSELDFWRIVASERARQKYSKPGFWERYGGILSMLVLGIILFLCIYVITKKFDVLATVSENLLRVAEALKTPAASTIKPAPLG